MTINPLLKRLGFSNNDRVVIFHADDIGMCHASVQAYQELIDYGLLSSAATMVPCSWFPAAATFCHQNQQNKPHIDMGVHLTLTSEWDSYRWGPISAPRTIDGLRDKEGYFYRQTKPAQENWQLEAVSVEVNAQIERALAAGIDVTHIDSHMGSIFHPASIPIYFEAAKKHKVPSLTLRAEALLTNWAGGNFSQEDLNDLRQMEADGWPMVDDIVVFPLDHAENRLPEGKQMLEQLPIGVTCVLLHPSVDTPELRAIAPDWRCRVADFELFRNDEWRKAVEMSGVHVIGWRKVRDLIRGEG